MGKRIAAIGFIFFCTAIAWAILASTIFYRTYSSDSQLRSKVASSWGAPQEQAPPTATYVEGSRRQVPAVENGKEILRTIDDRRHIGLTLQKSRVNAALHADYRRKGLLWYSTYQVQFAGVYEFVNPDDQPRDVTFTLHLPAEQAIYDDMVFTVNGSPLVLENQKTETYGRATVLPHQMAVLNVGYRSQGLDTWRYNFGDQVSQIRDFELRLTADFKGFDFPENTLSPTHESQTARGSELVWSYKNLVSGYKIGLALPQKLQPGPLAGRISYFAPVSLLFFFFVLFVLTTIRGINLHPMNYFFLACAFDTPGVRDLFGSFRVFARELLAFSGGNAIRSARSGARPGDLFDFVFVRLFLRRIHGARNHHWRDSHAVLHHADDGASALGRKIRSGSSAWMSPIRIASEPGR